MGTRTSPDEPPRLAFHVFLDGETIPDMTEPPLTDVERGVLVGVLLGEGHFGGDGK